MSKVYFGEPGSTYVVGRQSVFDTFGRFLSTEKEADFHDFTFVTSVQNIRLVIIVSFAFLVLAINDYLLHGFDNTFVALVLVRLAVVLLSLVVFFLVGRASVKNLHRLIWLWGVLVISLELLVVLDRPPGFFGVVTTTSFLILIFYLVVPQDLRSQLMLACLLSFGHVAISVWIEPIQDNVVRNTFLFQIVMANAIGFFLSKSIQISKRQEFLTRQALTASESHYRTLVHMSDGFVWTMLPDRRIDFVSAGTLAAVGTSSMPVNLESMVAIVHPEDRLSFSENVENAVRTGSRMNWTGRVRTPDGTHIWSLTRMSPMKYTGIRVEKWIANTTDINDLWAARNALAEANDRLEGSLARVRQLEKLLSICSFCKKIQDENGHWQQIESYISYRSETRFSHGICPECGKQHYGDVWNEVESSDIR